MVTTWAYTEFSVHEGLGHDYFIPIEHGRRHIFKVNGNYRTHKEDSSDKSPKINVYVYIQSFRTLKRST